MTLGWRIVNRLGVRRVIQNLRAPSCDPGRTCYARVGDRQTGESQIVMRPLELGIFLDVFAGTDPTGEVTAAQG